MRFALPIRGRPALFADTGQRSATRLPHPSIAPGSQILPSPDLFRPTIASTCAIRRPALLAPCGTRIL